MDESALRSALASLDDLGSSLHWWLGFWTALVVVGVAFEVVFVIWEYWEDLHDFKRGIIHAPEKPNMALFALGLLGAGMVAAGVAGELWEESKIATLETCIRNGNNALSLLLSKEAGNAAASATTARGEADAVRNETAVLKADLKEASKQIVAVSQQAEKVRSELDLVLPLLSVRSIRHPKETAEKLEHWSTHGGGPITFKSYKGDTEAFNLCMELWFMMSGKRPSAIGNCGQDDLPALFTQPISGLFVSGPTSEADTLAGMQLRWILLDDKGISRGNPAEVMGMGSQPNWEIFVGFNPAFSLDRLKDAEETQKQKTEQSSHSNR